MKNSKNKAVTNGSDKMIRYNFPEYGFYVEAKNMEEAQKKAKDLLNKKK